MGAMLNDATGSDQMSGGRHAERKLHQFPIVRSFMTHAPYTIGRHELLGVAKRLMREHDIRHLPVVEVETVVGLVSQQDLLRAEALPALNPFEAKVAEVMSEDVFSTSPDASLAEVVAEMARRRIGSAVIVEEGRCVGVFTHTDALTALTELLSEPA